MLPVHNIVDCKGKLAKILYWLHCVDDVKRREPLCTLDTVIRYSLDYLNNGEHVRIQAYTEQLFCLQKNKAGARNYMYMHIILSIIWGQRVRNSYKQKTIGTIVMHR